jgi:outer membrane protein OmpA-like peptidoglycan-associated protein
MEQLHRTDRGRASRGAASLLVLLATTFTAAAPASALGDSQADILAVLDQVEQSDDLGLSAWLNEGESQQVHVGDEIEFHFRTAADAYLTAIYVDASGAVTVLRSGGERSRVTAKQLATFPDATTGSMVAEPPLGEEVVFAIATLEPIAESVFDEGQEQGAILSFDSEGGRRFVRRLADYVSVLPPGSVDTARFSHTILSEQAPRRYSSSGIVSHFTTRTRSLHRRKLDLDIQFKFGSDELTEDAKKDLDELGRALNHPALKARRFELAGHTDDVGSDDYNLQLSKRRANAARAYLLTSFPIDAGVLEATGYGEKKPRDSATTSEARRLNRRVVIEQLP